MKFPFWDMHWYYVAKKASTTSKLLASGDGGDELFGGYTFRYEKFLSLIGKNPSTRKKIIAYLQCHERDWVVDQDDLFAKRMGFSWKEIYDIFVPYFSNPLQPLEQVFMADFHGKLRHNFSIVNTSINSHFGLKAITPLLSKKMIEYATHIPLELKYDKNQNLGKILLRQILHREKLERFVSKTKQGFSVNTTNLWKSSGYELCSHYLSDSRIVQQKLLSPSWIKKHLQMNLDPRYVNKFLGLLAMEIWYRIFVTKEMKATTTL
jgi:asparagine synthase (glutamine-hydrolysing)